MLWVIWEGSNSTHFSLKPHGVSRERGELGLFD